MLKDKILRRAAPIKPVPKLYNTQKDEPETVHFYTINSNNLEIDTVENENMIYKPTKVYRSSKNSEIPAGSIILHEEPPSKRILLDVVRSDPDLINVVYDFDNVVEDRQTDTMEIDTKIQESPSEQPSEPIEEPQDEVNEALLDHEDDQEKSTNQIDDDEPPMWMQTFLLRYDTDMKLIQEKLNKIIEKQELHSTTLQHLSKKINKIESSNNNSNKKQS